MELLDLTCLYYALAREYIDNTNTNVAWMDIITHNAALGLMEKWLPVISQVFSTINFTYLKLLKLCLNNHNANTHTLSLDGSEPIKKFNDFFIVSNDDLLV